MDERCRAPITCMAKMRDNCVWAGDLSSHINVYSVATSICIFILIGYERDFFSLCFSLSFTKKRWC